MAETYTGPVAKVDPDLCIACGACALECPKEAIVIEDIAIVDESLCRGCNRCAPVCPTGAIALPADSDLSQTDCADA